MPAFAKRHYEALAAAFRKSRPSSDAPAERHSQWMADRRIIVEMFEQDNPGFRADLWYKACDKVEK